MKFTPIKLPYYKEALMPHISAQTLEYHYEKHYKGYLNNCNNLIVGTEFELLDLNLIIRQSEGAIFNNAAQMSNHEIFFTSLSPKPQTFVDGEFALKIDETFGGLSNLKEEMSKFGNAVFGSGWVWLVLKIDGSIEVMSGGNGYTPILGEMIPLLCIDVWEHAYYLDYQNRRAEFLENIWNVVDWRVVQQRYDNHQKDVVDGCSVCAKK